jgi:hypothetical protein
MANEKFSLANSRLNGPWRHTSWRKLFHVLGGAIWYAGGVEKVVRVFHSFAEAEKAGEEYYRSLTPEQRLEILFELVQSQQADEPEQRPERVCRVIKLQED